MLSIARTAESLSFSLGSDVSLVHLVARQAEQFAQGFGIDDISRLSVVLRELMANAVTHGNHNAPGLTVTGSVQHLRKGLFRIVVEDEGEGFDYASLETALPDDPRGMQNRGYVLIRNICSAIEVNARGNRVTVHLDLADGGPTEEGADSSPSGMRRAAHQQPLSRSKDSGDSVLAGHDAGASAMEGLDAQFAGG